MNNDLISIVIPVYNVEKYLHKCVESVLNQTYENIEVILVDDGSVDSSGSICDDFAKIDSRVKAFHQENRGVSSARNKGLDEAKGEYIVFIDSDDWVSCDIVERLYSAVLDNATDMAICAYTEVCEGEELEISLESDVIIGDKSVADFVNGRFSHSVISTSCCKLFSKKTVSRYNLQMRYGEDLLFNIENFQNVKGVALLSKPMYFHRIYKNSTSLSNQFSPEFFSHFEVLYERALDMLYKKGNIAITDADEVHYKMFYYSMHFMKCFAKTFDKKSSKAYISRLCKSPSLKKAAKYLFKKRGLMVAVATVMIRMNMTNLLYWYINRSINK